MLRNKRGLSTLHTLRVAVVTQKPAWVLVEADLKLIEGYGWPARAVDIRNQASGATG